jgi:predicted permease
MIRFVRGLVERCRVLLARDRFEEELDEELRFHLEAATEKYVESGMSPGEARRAALRALGGVEVTKEEVRNETGVRLLQDLTHDLRFGVRTLLRRPGFTLALLATIGIAIGSNAAVFSVVYSILLEPLPFAEPDRIVRIHNSYPGRDVSRALNSVRDFYDRQEVDAFRDVALYTEIGHNVGEEGEAERVFAMQVTPSFFSVFAAAPALGSLFPQDLVRGAASYAVIGDALWRTAFGSDPGIVGSTIVLDGTPHEVTGVMPPGFEFATWDAQIYTPLVFAPEARFAPARNADRFHMVARLRADASVETAQRQLDAHNAVLVDEYPPEDRALALSAGFRAEVTGYLDDLTSSIRRPLLLLWVGAVIVLLAAIANVTTLFLIRATLRRREMSCRLALGAGRSRVLRQLLTESSIVAAFGGAIGIALAMWSLTFLDAFEVYEIPRIDRVGISPTVVGAGMLTALVVGTVAAVLPARGLLWGAGRSLGGGLRGGVHARPSRVHHMLVGLQVSFAFVLVMTTGLLVESLRHMSAVDVGFEPAGVAVGATNLPRNAYPDAAARVQFADALVDALRAHPDIEQAAIATQLPFSNIEERALVFPDGATNAAGEGGTSAYRTAVTGGYFDAMGIQLLAGETFARADDDAGRGVALVDEGLARLLWPEASPIGKRIWLNQPTGDSGEALEVIGVVASIRQNSLTDPQLPGAVYLPFSQSTSSFFRIATRTRADPGDAHGFAAEAVSGIGPGVLYYWVDTLGDAVGGSLLFLRLPLRLLSVFAGVSLFLVILGVYGVTTHVIRSRTRELGLRLALGDTQGGIAGLLAREWSAVVVAGLGVGVVGTLFVLQVVRSLLFGTSGLDLAVAGATLAIVFAASGLAFFWPVRHALRVDPARALEVTD